MNFHVFLLLLFSFYIIGLSDSEVPCTDVRLHHHCAPMLTLYHHIALKSMWHHSVMWFQRITLLLMLPNANVTSRGFSVGEKTSQHRSYVYMHSSLCTDIDAMSWHCSDHEMTLPKCHLLLALKFNSVCLVNGLIAKTAIGEYVILQGGWVHLL